MAYESYELAKHTLRYTLCTLPEKAVFSMFNVKMDENTHVSCKI